MGAQRARILSLRRTELLHPHRTDYSYDALATFGADDMQQCEGHKANEGGMSRREFVGFLTAAAGSLALGPPAMRSSVKLSLSEISTIKATFKDDLRAYAAAGFDAIG